MLRHKATEVQIKYRHLRDHFLDPVKAFECRYSIREKGVEDLEIAIRHGRNIMGGQPQVVKDKYPRLVGLYEPDDASFTWMVECGARANGLGCKRSGLREARSH